MTVYDQVRDCTVRLTEIAGQERVGTGFFVAPGYVLTCAHVVEPLSHEASTEFNLESSYGRWTSRPEVWRPIAHADIALVPIPSVDHPCVLFGAAAEPRDHIWSEGFLLRQGEIRLEPVTGEIEGERRARLEVGGPEYTLIKFKGGQIVPGMSGSPLVNEQTGAVCGIVARTLDEHSDTGGLAVPVRTILGSFPFLAERQSAYHQSHPNWRLSNLALPARELTEDEKVAAIRRLPPGPGVLMAIVPMDLVSRFYTLTFTDSTEVFRRANNLRSRAEPGVRSELITILNQPDPGRGLVEYWLAVFALAAARGPRMLAALVYEAAPYGIIEGLDDTVLNFLASLKTWPIG